MARVDEKSATLDETHAASPDVIGIELPDGSIWGNEANVKMRFDHQFVRMAAEGML